jgi:hypothetical protein
MQTSTASWPDSSTGQSAAPLSGSRAQDDPRLHAVDGKPEQLRGTAMLPAILRDPPEAIERLGGAQLVVDLALDVQRLLEAGGRRVKLTLPVRHAQWLDPVGPVCSQVIGRERAAGLAGSVDQPSSQLPAIELVGAAFDDAGQRPRQIALYEALLAELVGVKERPQRAANRGGSRFAEQRQGRGRHAALARGRWKALPGVVNG